ncbi:MAG: helix-hairpin-helix domain-containing protein [Vicinamibacterales bacterium]
MTTKLMVWMLAGALAAPALVSAAPQQAPAATRAAVLDLNTATQAQLEDLPGIGRQTAERIIEYRQKSGGFKKIEELMNVRGIGEKSFLKLKPLIAVNVKAEKAGGGR